MRRAKALFCQCGHLLSPNAVACSRCIPPETKTSIRQQGFPPRWIAFSILIIVVATILSDPDSDVGRANLQGAYVAQREFNDGSKFYREVQVRILIANTGSKTDYISNITQQIIQLAQADKTFVGVMGWPFNSYTIPAISALSSAN